MAIFRVIALTRIMSLLSGYPVTQKIYESSRTLVYLGRRESDGKPVAIKLLKNEYPTPRELALFRNQYTIAKDLDLPGIVRLYSLENYGNGLALVMEDFGANSLKDYIDAHPLSLGEFFAIAIQITQTLEQLHQNRIVHKDIKPANLLINPATGEVKITDFSIASILPRENQVLISPNLLEGTLYYLSPEQTGRMNRGIDYRTDFYSLGVTFYQLLTQQLPFQSDDPLELVHCHIARQPLPPVALNSAIPTMLSDLVMKLMAKMAEDRYQSASGLKYDLEICQQQWKEQQEITFFPLGQKDNSDRFFISEKLYGREAEVRKLLTAFDRVANPLVYSRLQKEMMLIAGYSGIGKSALVQEVYKPIVQQRGYFIAGKFDQFQRNIPYSAIVNAFQSLVRQLLTESEAKLNLWREKLLAAFGVNGQVIIDVIPEVELIVGKQPPVAIIAPTEAQNRFNLVFQNFIRVFCQKEHPLVIFLDDLQWADSATLKLIKLMLTDEQTRYLFLIGAYRDNEVSQTHPLSIAIEELQKAGSAINRIALFPLKLEHITQLIAETLHHSEASVKPLAELVMQKTQGNPFFVNEFLKTLHQENLLRFDFSQKNWLWNIAEIEAMDITDNVVELMIGKLKKLPKSTQKVLQFAACVGNSFDLKTLSIIYKKSIQEVFQRLTPAIREGLILPTSELEIAPNEAADCSLVIFNYKFLHDRVQQAAYATIDETQKQPVHLKIGRLLLEKTSPYEREERIFQLVEHLNLGSELIVETGEKIKLATLNLSAGKKAKSATAYAAARDYLIAARNSLSGNIWSEFYDLALELHKELAEVEYLNGNFEESKNLIYLTLDRAKSVIEKSEIYCLLILIYTLQTRYDEVIQTGREALNWLGIDLPKGDWETALNEELAKAKNNLAGKAISSLLDEPEMTIPEKKAATKLLTTMGTAAYISNQSLWLVMIVKLTNLSLQYGLLPEVSYGYSNYGIIISSMLGDYQAGYEFGQLSLKICDKFNDRAEKCKAFLVIGNCINHWVKPLKEDEAIFTAGYQAGLESGEIIFAGYCISFNLLSNFYSGVNLELLSLKIPDYLKFTQKTKNKYATDVQLATLLAMQTLQGVKGDINEAEYLQSCQEHYSFVAIYLYRVYKAQILYLCEEYAEAHSFILEAEKLKACSPGGISLAELNFYHSLILTALFDRSSQEEQTQYREKISANQKQMQIWAENCQENFLHMYLLVEAEIARISGNDWEAIDLYEQAIASASINGFVQNAALGNELAAKFWLGKGKENFAKLYLCEAYYNYQNWGANAKLAQLEKRYPHFLTSVSCNSFEFVPSKARVLGTISTGNSTSTSGSQVLDLASILKASQAISQEIELDKLLEILMKVVLENAGAENGSLVMQKDNQLAIAAMAISNQTGVTVLKSIPEETERTLPMTLINYVFRTQENLLIDNLNQEPAFALDPYIIEHQPKSILCLPVTSQSRLVGIIYLENNQTTAAFSSDRLEVLSTLSSQIAVSLENATLYQTLQSANAALQESEARERDRALQLEQSLHKLQQTQGQLIQTEKISSLGQLVAGVAHEVNNPVSFISGNLHYAETYVQDLVDHLNLYQEHLPNPPANILEHSEEIELEYLLEDLPKLLSSMKVGTERIRDIMSSLRTFSRVDEAEKKPVDIHAGIDSTLLILQHRFKAKPERPAIELIKKYGNLPLVKCYGGQLNQVFMNLLANAIDALEEHNQERSYDLIKLAPNQICIRTEVRDNFAVVAIADNGPGIPEHIQQRLFDPFFTTKVAGKGTGLGLFISHQIVTDKHRGQLKCISTPGQGTEFLIQIPLE